MYAIDVIFNNGSRLEGLLWTWRPKEGTFKALDETDGKIREYSLSSVKTGRFYSDRIREKSTFENFIDRAVNDGYKK